MQHRAPSRFSPIRDRENTGKDRELSDRDAAALTLARMRFAAKPVSELRLTRLHRWAMLWLKGFLAFLDAAAWFAPLSRQAKKIAHARLDSIERLIVSLLVIRVARCVRPLNRNSFTLRRGVTRDGWRRAVLGSALRRALRPKDVRARIEALLQDISTLVARLARRLPRGLTRRRGSSAPPALFAYWPRFISAPPPAADTS
jgi:hypothetical protein